MKFMNLEQLCPSLFNIMNKYQQQKISTPWLCFILGSHHLIGKLMKPFMQGTILINFYGRHTLLAEKDGIFDDLFSVGRSGAMEILINNNNFSNLDFPKSMEERGFPEDGSDGVKDFFFRSDGYKLWNILKGYVQGIVDKIYPSDSSVSQDKKLQEFSRSLADKDKGNIAGFPAAIHTRESLVTTLTIILFTPSVLHQVTKQAGAELCQYKLGA